MVQNHKVMLVLGLLIWYVGEAATPVRKQMVSGNVGADVDADDFSDIKEASFVRKQVKADGNIDASDVEAERSIRKHAISWKVGANGEVGFSDPKTSLVRKQMRANESIDASDAEAERPVRKRSDRTRSNQAGCKSDPEYIAYSSGESGEWISQFNTAVNSASTTSDGYYAWCTLFGCPQFNSQASAWCSSGGENACRNQCEALPDGPYPNSGRNGVCTRYTPTFTCTTCVDCSDRSRASTETDDGSFCYRLNDMVSANPNVCDGYWARGRNSATSSPCVYADAASSKSGVERCQAGPLPCCEGSAN